jgi:hypothetical protein
MIVTDRGSQKGTLRALSPQVTFGVVAYKPLRIPFVERLLVKPNLYASLTGFADNLVVMDEISSKLTKFIEDVSGYQAFDVRKWNYH